MGLGVSPVEDAELWAWSGAWLVYGAALMALGIRTRGRALRMAALGIVGLVAAKVFLVDMAISPDCGACFLFWHSDLS